MKINRLYIIIFLLLSVTSSQSVFGVSTVQEPEYIRKFDDDFKARYSSRKYNYEGREIVNQTPSGSGKYEDYKNGKPTQKDENNADGFSINLGPFAWLFYLALAVAVIYLVYVLLNEGGTGLFSTKQNRKLTHYEDITAENIENADIDTLILNAEKDHDFRLAIRYYYLLVLKTLSIKNHIKFEDDKTNAEYLNEISEKPFSKKFAYASYLYNYIWYGEFPLNTDEYNKAKHNFTTLLNQFK
ncbi:hypothetical protein [Hwangdonia seohaensis]|uniref:DUF4129 domain-containing protein n=1 Tax=Hwangdonia seohaensis TaxID=1240727 RepID=A0ABW3RE73_9FLAO|nr:hypothetical protein [Hwangdonia seohaensis]